MRGRVAVTGLFWALFSLPVVADEVLATVWRVEGFAQPESVLYDAARDQFIVSNIHGLPTETDGNGYLSRVSGDGTLLSLRWVEGMDAPKGMAVHGDRLYVADIQRLHIVDLQRGIIVESVMAEQAQFLNDVAADADGNVYVSDMLGQSIYRYDGDQFEPWYQSPALEHPNGLAVHGSTLYIGNWGKGLRDDFSTEAPGRLLAVNLKTLETMPLAGGERIANIDGVIATEGGVLISDWLSGKLHWVPYGGTAETVAKLQPGVADIGASDSLLLLPLMPEAAVEARPLSSLIREQ